MAGLVEAVPRGVAGASRASLVSHVLPLTLSVLACCYAAQPHRDKKAKAEGFPGHGIAKAVRPVPGVGLGGLPLRVRGGAASATAASAAAAQDSAGLRLRWDESRAAAASRRGWGFSMGAPGPMREDYAIRRPGPGWTMPCAAVVGVPLFLRGADFGDVTERLAAAGRSCAAALEHSRMQVQESLQAALHVLSGGGEDGSSGGRVAENTVAALALAPAEAPPGTAPPGIVEQSRKRVPGSVNEAPKGAPKYDVDGLLSYSMAVLDGSGWSQEGERGGVSIWKKYLPKDQDGADFPVIKARSVLNAPVAEVVSMIEDSSRVKEYNKYSLGRSDVQLLNKCTKIMYNRAKVPMVSRPHDFCSLMHTREMRDGSVLIVTTAVDHPKCAQSDKYIRSRIMLGLSVCKPCADDPERKTEFTTVTHVVSGGVPVMVADRLSGKNAIDYILSVSEALRKRLGQE